MNVPWMQPIEIYSILKMIRPNEIVLEWGCGGSTLLFSPFVKHYYSIESNKPWHNAVKKDLETYKNKNVSLYLVENENDNYKNYIKKVNDLGVHRFDIVLIDGRKRIQCAIEVLPYIDIESIVLLHDAKREKYQSIFEHYDLLAEIKELYFLSKKYEN